jgi:hypothetical protein
MPRSRRTESTDDQRTLGLSEDAHAKLTRLRDDGLFAEMRDAYRIAIALAITEGKIAPAGKPRPHTYINAGSLDPDGVLRDVIAELFEGREGQPYEVAERLGEAGVLVLWDRVQRNPQFARLLQSDEEADPTES